MKPEYAEFVRSANQIADTIVDICITKIKIDKKNKIVIPLHKYEKSKTTASFGEFTGQTINKFYCIVVEFHNFHNELMTFVDRDELWLPSGTETTDRITNTLFGQEHELHLSRACNDLSPMGISYESAQSDDSYIMNIKQRELCELALDVLRSKKNEDSK